MARADSWRGKVVGVADGDTLKVLRGGRAIKVRLWGIDCPERRQPYGSKAKQFSSKAVFGKIVTVEAVTRDRYGRTIGRVSWLHEKKIGGPGKAPRRAERKRLSHELLRAGLAWWYRRYAPDARHLERLERRARGDAKGLWADGDPVPPWRWRRARRRAR